MFNNKRIKAIEEQISSLQAQIIRICDHEYDYTKSCRGMFYNDNYMHVNCTKCSHSKAIKLNEFSAFILTQKEKEMSKLKYTISEKEFEINEWSKE